MEQYIEVLIFLAFAAFSLLSQFLNKKKKAVTRAPEEEMERDFRQEPTTDPPVTARPRRRNRPAPSTRTPTSLEEILRELTGQPVEPTLEEEEDDYELPPYLQEKKEEVTPSASELAEKIPSAPEKLTDKVALQDDSRRIKPIKVKVSAKRRKQSLGASVAQSLRNPGSAKRAVILSEILQRKHF